ncbi:MAG: LysM peptidoglycan-binding domain-containing protein [Schleiferiaceae bacterium]|nr:LysM peptidoglycan-binding domain-containing protein [Schleiferiaceae bacterium]
MLASLILSFGLSHAAGFCPENDTIKALTTKDSLVAATYVWEDDPFAARLDSLLKMNVFGNGNDTLAFYYLSEEDSIVPSFHDSIYRARLAVLDLQSPFELAYHPEVRRYIDVYTQKRRGQVSRMLGLAELYFPLFEATLDEYNLPLELKYLAIVESALNPQARSRVGATGLWQFMYWTGKMQGLEITSYVDERSDPIKSTRAAAEFLSKLYDTFGDWSLALAAYNAGPGNVNKAIRRSGGKTTYWEIRPYLPRETAGYVPAFIAVNYVMQHAEDHNLYPTKPAFAFGDLDTIAIKEKISFDQLAQHLNFEKEKIALLNPSYKLGIVPGSAEKPQFLTLPIEQVGVFITNEDTLYKIAVAELATQPLPEVAAVEPAGNRVVHRVKRGETLGSIANQHRVSVKQIQNWNNLRGTMIREGQKLVIYSNRTVAAAKPAKSQKKRPSTETGKIYTVKSGDTFYGIASQYPGVSAESIMEVNGFNNAKTLQPGMTIAIPQ